MSFNLRSRLGVSSRDANVMDRYYYGSLVTELSHLISSRDLTRSTLQPIQSFSALRFGHWVNEINSVQRALATQHVDLHRTFSTNSIVGLKRWVYRIWNDLRQSWARSGMEVWQCWWAKRLRCPQEMCTRSPAESMCAVVAIVSRLPGSERTCSANFRSRYK